MTQKQSSEPVLGNAAEELGQYEQGKDFQNLNHSSLADAGEAIEVGVTRTPLGTVVVPLGRSTAEFHRALGEFQESPSDQTMAELTEEVVQPPAGIVVKCADPGRLAQVSQRSQLIWYGVRKSMAMAVNGDRILIEQDTLESEHSCRKCHGRGHGLISCPTCKGYGSVHQDDASLPCPDCRVTTFDTEQAYSCGQVPCLACRGNGWRGGIIIPEIAQTKPVTGIVVSVGPLTQLAKLGDRILHSKYTGHSLTTPEGRTYTMMHESEVLAWLQQMGEQE